MVLSRAAGLRSLCLFPVCPDDLNEWIKLERDREVWEGILLGGKKMPQLGEWSQLFGANVNT